MEQRIAAGVYKCRGVEGSEQYGFTSNGNDQIVVELDLTDIGERVSTFLVVTDKTLPFVVDRLRALGWEGDDLSNLVGIGKNEASVEIKYEEYQGKLQMRVQILTGGGRVVLQNTMDEKQKRAFGAKFRGAIAGGKPQTANATGDASFPFGANAPQQRAGGVKL